MRYVLDAASMKNVDSYSINTLGIPSVVLMERAAYRHYMRMWTWQ